MRRRFHRLAPLLLLLPLLSDSATAIDQGWVDDVRQDGPAGDPTQEFVNNQWYWVHFTSNTAANPRIKDIHIPVAQKELEDVPTIPGDVEVEPPAGWTASVSRNPNDSGTALISMYAGAGGAAVADGSFRIKIKGNNGWDAGKATPIWFTTDGAAVLNPENTIPYFVGPDAPQLFVPAPSNLVSFMGGVPTLSEWGLAVAAGVFLGLGIVQVARRRKR